MEWKKLGFIYNSEKENDYFYSHAMLPFAVNIHEDIFRIYFSPRDKQNRSNGSYVDIDIKFPQNILNISKHPIIEPGEIGHFDESGAQPCSIVMKDDTNYLYYVGWSLSKSIPFRTFLGLATKGKDDTKYRKISNAPILSWDKIDNLSIGWSYVIFHENKFKIWYESNVKWENVNDNYTHYFVIKYAESNDGINWHKHNKICIQTNENANVVSRPSVVIDNNIYKMWYSYKTNNLYKIGYAESQNGIDWIRKDDQAGINVSETGWDSEQIEYPFVFDHKNERYMLYNGNGYGKTGFGLAKLIK